MVPASSRPNDPPLGELVDTSIRAGSEHDPADDEVPEGFAGVSQPGSPRTLDDFATQEVVLDRRQHGVVRAVHRRFESVDTDGPSALVVIVWHDENHLDQLKRALEGLA